MGGVPRLWMNCAEIVFAVARPLGKLLTGEYGEINILKLCEIIVFIIYVLRISV